MKRSFCIALLVSHGLLLGCAAKTANRWPTWERPIVINAAERTVRFGGVVPIVAKEWPLLEVLVCTPDTREHEALVMTNVRPSHIHAALLGLGAEPGTPGGLVWDGDGFVLEQPTGPRIGIRFNIWHQEEMWVNAASWFVTDPRTPIDKEWLFTGSTESKSGYAADMDGTIVGLVSFTTEVIGLSTAVPDIDHQRDFEFLPDEQKVPPFGTRVVVELRLLD